MAPLIAFKLTVPAAAEEEATALLWERGTCGVEVQSQADASVLLAYFPATGGLEAVLRRDLGAIPGARIERAEVPEVDWVVRFREGFRAFEAGGFLVAPCWDVPARADRAVLVVDPGRAFGTGTHESTRLCLDLITALRWRGALGRVLDVGTGSGILAVAAALRGAAAVTAVDIDPECLRSALRHAALNKVELRLVQADGAGALRPGRFDLVLANLSAPLLHERRAELVSACAPGGALVLAGFLVEDAPGLSVAYAASGAIEVRREGEWAALLAHCRMPGALPDASVSGRT